MVWLDYFYVVVDCIYIALFSALKQIHCTFVACDSESLSSLELLYGHRDRFYLVKLLLRQTVKNVVRKC